ncbi:MAG: ribonucleotide reductase large subunit [Actinomycetia bacterium]|nr:ribonucleotide reductase large subunit [Actinomycetes bacterium]
MVESAIQRHLPRRRTGHTTSVTIGGERFYLTANGREDGTLGEVFIQWGKQGTTGAGLMDLYAVALSVGLQHGIPLIDLIHQGLDLYFVPNGHTDDPEIPRVRSVVDWIARRLAIDWLPYEERAAEGIFTVDERVTAASDWLATEAAKFPSSQGHFNDPAMEADAVMETFRAYLELSRSTVL